MNNEAEVGKANNSFAKWSGETVNLRRSLY